MNPRQTHATALDEARPEHGLTLGEIAREIPGTAEITGDRATLVFGVRHDSRAVLPGELFVARKGEHADGARFVLEAKARGASAVLAARGSIDASLAGLPVVFVDDVGDGLAYASAAVYGHPAFGLEIIGVTGTNGKTTSTHLMRAGIDGALGASRCGTIGTVGHSFAGQTLDASHTTPEADELARVMAAMKKRGASHVAMEVSSIALALGRVKAVRFRVAALTNLTQDHLDFHGSMDRYAEAKAELFTRLSPASAVVNVDDAFGRKMADVVRAPVVRVSTETGAKADIAPLSVAISATGIEAEVRTPRGQVTLRSRLVGLHNLENLLVALGVVCALDLDVTRAALALGGETGAPGRLERCDGPGDDVTVLVDYAHTPDALARVLDSLRNLARGRIWCVFGCGGDRDSTKRAPMGQAVGVRADVAIVTSDNPRTESPEAIARSVEDGVVAAGLAKTSFDSLRGGTRGYHVELDRARAIESAILASAPGDVVLLAGKGHEDYQVIGTQKRAFDDRAEARRALARRRGAA